MKEDQNDWFTKDKTNLLDLIKKKNTAEKNLRQTWTTAKPEICRQARWKLKKATKLAKEDLQYGSSNENGEYYESVKNCTLRVQSTRYSGNK